jgi:hypothetical protein
MKTSNSVLCAVVVLGLSAVVSSPQALAQALVKIEITHPATMCLRISGANITRASGGTIENTSSTTPFLSSATSSMRPI